MLQVTLDDIKRMASEANGQIKAIYLHWSAGHYGQFFEDYHLNIDKDGNIYASTDDLTERKQHTYMHNTGAVGVSMACCAFATTDDLGSEPPTLEQIESMAQIVATITKYADVPMENVKTHAEVAEEDGYGYSTTCERWDLLFLNNDDRTNGGDIIRGKAQFYLNYV